MTVIELSGKSIFTRITLITKQELLALPNSQTQAKALYRRFMRLAYFLPKRKHSITFQSIIKSRFEKINSFNIKSQKILPDSPIITNDELIERTINTLEFVSRAMCFNNDIYSNIVMNIIAVEESKLQYLEKARNKFALIDYYIDGLKYHNKEKHQDKKTEKKYQEINSQLIGLKDFDITLMRLNETEKLCL